MKNIIIILLLTIAYPSFCQNGFLHDILIDSLATSQQKLFIRCQNALNNNPKFSINYIDFENKIINGRQSVAKKYGDTDNIKYEYKITLFATENNIRMIIDTVYCIDYKEKFINAPLSLSYPDKIFKKKYKVIQENYYKLMKDINSEIRINTFYYQDVLKTPL